MKNGIAGIEWHLRFNRIVFQFSYRTDTDVTFDNLNRRYFLSVTQYDQFILWYYFAQTSFDSEIVTFKLCPVHNYLKNLPITIIKIVICIIWYLFFCQFSSVLLVVGGYYLSANIKLREIAPSKNNIHLF